MNNTKRPFIDVMYGYDNSSYNKLLSNALYTQAVVGGGLSLTLVNNVVNRIITTRNNKYRRRAIDELYDLLSTASNPMYTQIPESCDKFCGDSTSVSRLCLVMVVLHSFNCNLSKLKEVPIRIMHNGNSPWYLSTVIGDSKHYKSCLSSGVIVDNVNTFVYSEKDWVRLIKHRDQWPNKGCNYDDYVDDEVSAFIAGHIMYLTAGDACYESPNSEGFNTRIRVHVVSKSNGTSVTHSTDEAKFLVDAVYGDYEYVTRMLRLLHDTYPGRVYLTEHYTNVKYSNIKLTKRNELFKRGTCGVYSDYDCSGYMLTEVNDLKCGTVYKLNQERPTHVITTQSGTTRTERYRLFDVPTTLDGLDTKVERARRYNAHTPKRGSFSEVYFTQKWVLMKVAARYGTRLQLNDKYESGYVHHTFRDTRINVCYNNISWMFRGTSYDIQTHANSVFLKRVRDVHYVYNWVTGMWDDFKYNHVLSLQCYCIPRKRFSKILEHMPKSLEPVKSRKKPR